ncbi:MAG: metal-binding protein [bacterium]
MSCGRTHDLISLIFTPFVLLISLSILDNLILTGVLISSFIFSSFMFNGDLDIKSSPYYRWSIFRFIWIPYQMIFRHRSVFTHGLIIGTLVRLIYLFIIPVIILYVNDVKILEIIRNDYVLFVVIGLEAGAALHTITDFFPKIL